MSGEAHRIGIDRRRLADLLDRAGWGLFFVWVGIGLLFDVGWGIGCLGIGIIVLAGQAARKYCGLRLEGFWVLVGLGFLVGAVWEIYEITLSLVPLLLIVGGLAVLSGALQPGRGAAKPCGLRCRC